MIKFVHKKHMGKKGPGGSFIIYYSETDIVLAVLVVLTLFFAASYVQDHLSGVVPDANASFVTHVLPKRQPTISATPAPTTSKSTMKSVKPVK